MNTLRRAAVHAAPVAALALALWLVVGANTINQDSISLLGWGRDLARGSIPDYTSTLAPTPHPLPTLILGVFSIFGETFAYYATVAFSYLALGGLTWCVVLLGKRFGGWPAGIVAGLLVLSSGEIVWRGAIGQQDVLAAALVLAALLMEIDRPRRGVGVLIVLAAAGLVRPEAWLLSGAYWLWLALGADNATRLRLALIAGSAPVLWVLSDLIAAGDPVFSARVTHEGAEALGRITGIENVPRQLRVGIETVIGGPVALAGIAGLALAAFLARSRAVIAPAALLACWLAAYTALGTAELSLNARYLFVVAVVLCALCGYAVLGWVHHPGGAARWAWAVAGVAAIVAGVALGLPDRLDRLREIRTETVRQGRAIADLRDLAESTTPPCRPLLMPNHAAAAWIAYAFEFEKKEIADGREAAGDVRGSFIAANGADADALVRPKLFRPTTARNEPPAGFERVAGNDSWTIYAGCG